MSEQIIQSDPLPTARQIRQAIERYIEVAYGGQAPDRIRELLPPDEFVPAEWLMSDSVERDPSGAPLPAVRSFAVRLGNSRYPHMKLRMSLPPRDRVYLFSVDSHDGFLHASAGTEDHAALEALKAYNSSVASMVVAAWEADDLLTERNYLRQKIKQARRKNTKPGH